MQIRVGNIISRTLMDRLLSIIQSEDLNGLKSVVVRVHPIKKVKKETKHYGSLLGYYCEKTPNIHIHAYPISCKIQGDFNLDNNNYLDMAFRQIAETLYHEIGHHHHYKSNDPKIIGREKLEKRIERRIKEHKKLKKEINSESNIDLIELQGIISSLQSAISDICNYIEEYADEYSKRMMRKAEKNGLFRNQIKYYDMPFFMFTQDRYIRTYMEDFIPNRFVCKHTLAVFECLRKRNMGHNVKWSIRDMVRIIFDTEKVSYSMKSNPKEYRRLYDKVKSLCLKHLRGRVYVSKTGRRYYYYTDYQLDKLHKIINNEIEKNKSKKLVNNFVKKDIMCRFVDKRGRKNHENEGLSMRTTATRDGLPRNAKLPEILFNDERLKYLDAVESFEDLIFARLGMYSGLRLKEALGITPNDIVFPERAVSVVGKGNKQRYVPVDHATLQLLRCYLNDRGLDQHDKISSVTPRTIQNRVAAYAEKAGINRIQVTPHTLRHTACSLMLYRKVPLEIVQKIMGHADISTTMIYFHVVPNIVVRSYYEAFGEGLI